MIASNQPVAYVNGAFVPENEAVLSAYDRGLRFADTVFETTRTIGHKPYKFREHLERLRGIDHVNRRKDRRGGPRRNRPPRFSPR